MYCYKSRGPNSISKSNIPIIRIKHKIYKNAISKEICIYRALMGYNLQVRDPPNVYQNLFDIIRIQ